MVEVLMLGPRRDDFFDVVARQYLGGGVRVRSVEREKDRDKRQKSKMPFSNQIEFDDVALNTYP